MGKLVQWPGGRRGGAAALLVVLLAVAASIAYGDRNGVVRAPGASAAEIAALLQTDAGTVVVDPHGRPVKGPDGKPLRVAEDGRTLLTSTGRALRDRRGRALRIERGGRLPAAARRQLRTEPRRAARRPSPRRAQRPRRRAPARPAAPATSESPVVVGLTWIDPEWLKQAYAIYNIDPGAVDPTAAARAVVARVNAGGGMGGRSVELRTHEIVPGNGYDAAFEAACTHFRAGPRPLAVIGPGVRVDHLGGCLGRVGIALIADPAVGPSRAWLSGMGSASILPAAPAIDRIQEPLVAALAEDRFFDAPVGVAWLGRDDHRAGAAALKAALAARGIQPADEQELTSPAGLNDIPRVAAEMSSLMVRFRASGVRRMLAIDHAGEFTMLLMLAAEAQGFRPRWGITSASGPHQLTNNIQREQLQGATGIGWYPQIDVLERYEGARSDTYGRCSEIFRAAGAPVGGRAIFGQGGVYAACDGLLLLQTALAGREPTAAALQSAVDGLGTGFTSALGFATRLGAGRRDGMDAYRRLRFAGDCGCFKYE